MLLSKLRRLGRHTLWGFPLAPPGDKAQPPLPPGSRPGRQKGIALLIAILSIALMISLVSELIVSSTVNVELAIASRNRIKAEYLAKSGFNLAVYLLSASYLWDHILASGLLGQKQEATDGPNSLWNIVNSWPPMGASTVSLLQAAGSQEEDPFGIKGFMNEKVAEQMRLFEDQFTVRISDEKSRINISSFYSNNARADEMALAQLEALFSCPPEKAFLESKNLAPRELAFRIRDFINQRSEVQAESNLASKHEPYESQTPPYKAKGALFDTVEELKLVAGWDDDLHAVFSPYITIYPFPHKSTTGKGKTESVDTLNLNTASRELLLCLFSSSLKEGSSREKAVQKLYEVKEDLSDNLASDSKQINKRLEEVFAYRPQRGEGEEGKADQRDKWFVLRSDVFRIEVEAETGSQKRKLIAVIRRLDKGNKEGLVQKREVARAYQLLYWKLI